MRVNRGLPVFRLSSRPMIRHNPPMQTCYLLWLLSLLVLAGCGGKNPAPSGTAAEQTAAQPAAATTGQPAESRDEDRALELYERWENARTVKLSPSDIAALPAQAAQSARQRGEVIDLELLMGSDANRDLFLKLSQAGRKQVEAVEQEVGRQPKAVQDIFRSLLSGRGIRNPQLVDNARVIFECDDNAYDSADTDQHSDIYLWDLKDGSVKCLSIGQGIDGDWACRELSAAAGGNAFAFERRFMGPREKLPKDSFKGIVWYRDGAVAPIPLAALEPWTPQGNFFLPKPGEDSFFQRPALSGNGQRIAAVAYFRGASQNDPPNYEPGAPLLVLTIMDRTTQKIQALAKGEKIGPYALSRDGGTLAVYGIPWVMEGGKPDRTPAIYRLPSNGRPAQRIALPKGVTIDEVTDTRPALSADGSRLVFEAFAGAQRQIYLYDSAADMVILLSATPAGAPGNGASSEPAISGDGNTVAFVSLANNLLPGAGSGQIYTFNVPAHALSVAALNTNGAPSRGTCHAPTLNNDGSLLAFLTTAEDMPGIRLSKKPRPGPVASRLFAVRLKDRKSVPLGGTLNH